MNQPRIFIGFILTIISAPFFLLFVELYIGLGLLEWLFGIDPTQTFGGNKEVYAFIFLGIGFLMDLLGLNLIRSSK